MTRSEQPDKPHFDYKQIELFGMCSLPVEDMSAILNISAERLQGLMDRPASKFFRSYRKGQALTRFNLLQRQIATATGEAKGNPALLTHLGVILLGQDDSKKRQTNDKQAIAEQLIQNVSETQKANIYQELTGISPDQDNDMNDHDPRT